MASNTARDTGRRLGERVRKSVGDAWDRMGEGARMPERSGGTNPKRGGGLIGWFLEPYLEDELGPQRGGSAPPSEGKKDSRYEEIARNLEQAGWVRATPAEMAEAKAPANVPGEWWKSGGALVLMTADGAKGARMLSSEGRVRPEASAQRPVAAKTPTQSPAPTRQPATRRPATPESPSVPAGQPSVPPATQAALAPSNGRPQPSLANMGAAAMRGRSAGAPQMDATPRREAPPSQFMAGEQAYPTRKPAVAPTTGGRENPQLRAFAEAMKAEGKFSGKIQPGETLLEALKREGVDVPIGFMS